MAIYAIKRQKEPAPVRKRVLKFIRIKKLISYQAIGPDMWGDEEKVWTQFFSWCRENLTQNGWILYRGGMDRGIWQLSQSGLQFVESKIDKWTALGKSADEMLKDLQSFQDECIYSREFVELLLKIGNERKINGEIKTHAPGLAIDG